jgi:hypothetical protein
MNAAAFRVPYERTFLAKHIHEELYPQSRPSGRPREEVLALDNLRYRLQQAFPSLDEHLIRSAVTVTDFFYGGLEGIGTHSDLRLYLEVPVTRLPEAAAGAQTSGEQPAMPRWRELTYLLRDSTVTPRGVVLRARSGAGKTVAMLKAFHDCFHSPGKDKENNDLPPQLAGWLACYLRDLTPRVVFEIEKNCPDFNLIEGLLLHSAGYWPSALQKVRSWLRHCDPLLIFLDLNTAAAEVAVLLSHALPEFQHRYAEQRHRCVVAYRSFGQDTVVANLRDLGGFAFYDLEPLRQHEARLYLEHLSSYETWLRKRLQKQTEQEPQYPVSAYDIERLERLIRQHVGDQENVLSTPLLTHLFSLLRGEQQRQVRCLADVYQEVTEEYLDREYGPLDARPRKINAPRTGTPHPDLIAASDVKKPEWRVRLKAALVRVAFAILGQPTTDQSVPTRLQPRDDLSSDEVLDGLLESADNAKRWCPADEVWRDGEYFTNEYKTEEQRGAVKKSSLLRLDGNVYGFLHDSFLYYFAALGVRCRKTPKLGLSTLDASEGPFIDPWYSHATRRLRSRPRTWRLPAEFLGGLLQGEELLALVQEVLLTEPEPGWPEILLSLVRGRRPAEPAEPLLAGVECALMHKRPGVLGANCEDTALATEIYHYLRDAAKLPEVLREWLKRLEQRLRTSGLRWLRVEGPTYWPLPTLRAHRGVVRCVAVVDERRVVAGGSDGQVILWDQEAGNWQILHRHQGAVREVAVCGDGHVVVSGGDDGVVWRSVDGRADLEPLLRHEGIVWCVAVSTDGRVVVSGGDDGVVWRSVDGQANLEPLLFHEGKIYTVAVSDDGHVVVSGGDDGVVRRSVDGWADPEPLLRHQGEIHAVAVSGDGRVVVSGGRDGEVKQAVDGHAKTEPLPRHEGWVDAVAVSSDGRVIVSGGYDGMVWRTVDGHADPKPLLHHESQVHSVAVSADGGVVVSAGYDRAVRRAVDGRADGYPLLRHTDVAWAVGVNGDGRVVVSGGDDGVVRRSVDGALTQ